ncbi:MAG: hypothetical protein IJ736_00680 [Firmicutes bacterium]|nr:hypothetical protein [Bacillota bacterium]
MKNDKYYSKTVDIKDLDTWIDKVLLEKLHKYDYQCLSRCLSDCKYFLGNGNMDTKYLWGGQDVESHISEMKRIYNRLPIKPKWLTMEQIEEFEKAMK